MFEKIEIIGIGLIGSSLARVIKKEQLAKKLVAFDANKNFLQKALELEIVDDVALDLRDAVENADIVVLATPVGAYGKIVKGISKHLKSGAIITDVGSV